MSRRPKEEVGERMKRLSILLVAVAALLGLAVGPAVAQLPPHPHMLILGLELDETGEPVDFRKCIDLASGHPVPLNAHHSALHVGRGGEALFTHAGHLVVPGAPVSPFANCEELIDFFFGE